ncbi:MAG: hypothetical protein LBF67_08660 [Prevotellaceae bacterium]|jgi:hypothetical protein|nr:hypothetical protein [Prevotellaceae bacterium]
MSRKLLFTFIVFFFTIPCATRLAARRPQPPDTERLLRDLQVENCCLPGGTPSPEVIRRYRLRRLGKDSSYCVNGFLSVSKNAQPSDFVEFGLIVSTRIDSLWTAHVPVQRLPALLDAKGVKLFEVGKKVTPKGSPTTPKGSPTK